MFLYVSIHKNYGWLTGSRRSFNNIKKPALITSFNIKQKKEIHKNMYIMFTGFKTSVTACPLPVFDGTAIF